LNITSSNYSTIKLAWEDNSGIEAAYLIERKKDTGNFESVDTVDANITSYSDVVANLGTYAYRVCAIKDGQRSLYSNEVFSVVTTLLPPIPTEGLLAYWPFNGNANDESGNGNNGIVYGPILSEDRHGILNSAYYFDGIDDYIECNLNSSTTEFSVSAWFNMKSHAGWDNNIIAQYASDYNHYFSLLTRGDQIEWHRFSAAAGPPNLLSTTFVQNDIWYNIIITVEGNIHKMYVNGSIEATSTSAFQVSNTMPIRIGQYNSGHYTFHGFLDDIRLYSRALSETEIQALYCEAGWGN